MVCLIFLVYLRQFIYVSLFTSVYLKQFIYVWLFTVYLRL